ncbi:MAG: DUF5110 domain-containing protein, partial [Candidatus Acidiferrum sp.]
ILPLGPVKQFTGEKVEQPLTLFIYSGKDASFLLYEDDGTSFNYRNGEWMGIEMAWKDATRTLTLGLAPGSCMLAPVHRTLDVKLEQQSRSVTFDGNPLRVSF